MVALMSGVVPAFAQRASILDTAAAPLIAADRSGVAGVGRNGSLFVDRAVTGYFAPVVVSASRSAERFSSASQLDRLMDLIATAEAGADGYDAVQYGARVRPPRPPTQMRLGEITAWIAATPGQPHAIGRYQFIPTTLARLAEQVGVRADELFSPALQDRLAVELLREAGLTKFQSGDLDRESFMNNLARVWAGLPTSSGRSYYHGHAGNAATMTWVTFEQEMAAIYPENDA
ncbi:hypothetical protein [Pelagovum pacificum]|uniref:hypothetical protein n=1 Tax=Pelagovum pacificum TaxID=2588711 RepID=UPI001E3C6C0E|nr:hypothetical protein [Pelagovum pacificum]